MLSIGDRERRLKQAVHLRTRLRTRHAECELALSTAEVKVERTQREMKRALLHRNGAFERLRQAEYEMLAADIQLRRLAGE